MIGTFSYFLLDDTGFTEDAVNGHIPGIEWTDVNGHEYRAICTSLDFANFMMKSISYDYWVYIKPIGLEQWLKQSERKVYINNNNLIDAPTGDFVTDPDSVSVMVQDPETHLYTRVINEGEVRYMYQFDYFVMLAGKNIPGAIISLYAMVQSDILRREGLFLTQEDEDAWIAAHTEPEPEEEPTDEPPVDEEEEESGEESEEEPLSPGDIGGGEEPTEEP